MTIANAARALNLRARRRFPRARTLPNLLLMTDSRRLPDPRAALDRLPRGAAVVLRHYADDAGARDRLARALIPALRARGLRLLIAGDPRLAYEVGADGVHLPEWMVAVDGLATRRVRLRSRWIVTAACHSEHALRAAALIGADAAVLAPVFSTASHLDTPSLGAVRFTGLVRRSLIPVYALGGIDEAGARRIGDSGAVGIAGIGFAASGD